MAKTTTTKTTKGKTAATKTAPAAKKDGLRKGQIRILECLSKSKNPLPRKVIAEKAPVDQANCVELIGSPNDDIRKANDAKHYPSLLSLGFVKEGDDEENGRVYGITPAGKKALEAAKKAAE